jgi:hypothetical protein
MILIRLIDLGCYLTTNDFYSDITTSAITTPILYLTVMILLQSNLLIMKLYGDLKSFHNNQASV